MYKFSFAAGALLSTLLSSTTLAHQSDLATVTDASDLSPWWVALLRDARAAVTIREDQGTGIRIVESDGLPDHASGRFPNRNNPNAISAQRYHFEMPLDPVHGELVIYMNSLIIPC